MVARNVHHDYIAMIVDAGPQGYCWSNAEAVHEVILRVNLIWFTVAFVVGRSMALLDAHRPSLFWKFVTHVLCWFPADMQGRSRQM